MASKTLLLAALALPVAAHAQVNVVDNFSDHDRLDGSPLTWYSLNNAGTTTTVPNSGINDGKLTVTSTGSSRTTYLATYFTPSATPFTLTNAGDYIVVSTDFAISHGASGGTLSIGLMNSGGSRLSADVTNAITSPAITSTTYYGYRATTPLGDGSHSIFERSSTTTNTGNAFFAGNVELSSSPTSGIPLGTGLNTPSVGNLSLRIERLVDNSVSITTFLNGTQLAQFTDTVNPSYTYDTFVILVGNAMFGQTDRYVSFDNVTITGVSVIPEPSSAAALVGVFALGAVALRRRRK